MARGFSDLVATTFCAGREAPERGTLLNVDGFHLQFVDIGTIVVFSIGNGGLQNLLDDHGSFFLRELQNVQSLIHFFATDQVRDQTAFVDRETNAPKGCTCFHGQLLISFGLFCPQDDP
jgi:hypothetical protein